MPTPEGVPPLTPPHCDQDILHAPGECRYCDAEPLWQQLRVLWGIAFTGHPPRITTSGGGRAYEEIACPSDIRRLGGVANRWPGNQPRPGDQQPEPGGD